MPFPVWWMERFLLSLGWPRKRGLLGRRQVINALVLDGAVNRLAQASCGLGASRPDLAARGIAQVFSDRTWDIHEAIGVVDWLEGFASVWDEETRTPWGEHALTPWEAHALCVPRAAELARREDQRDPPQSVTDLEVPIEALDAPKYRNSLCSLWAGSLYFGMKHPATVERFAESEIRDFNEGAPGWRAAGANIPETNPWVNVDAFYENCREFITTYEAEVQSLPPVPARLREALADRLGN